MGGRSWRPLGAETTVQSNHLLKYAKGNGQWPLNVGYKFAVVFYRPLLKR